MMMATCVCALVLAGLVYRYDMYEREPPYMLVLAALLGGTAYWLLSYGEDLVLRQIPGGTSSLAVMATVAGICEETAKLMIVLLIWAAIPRHFNDPFDGLIYGAMAGLGFAIGESWFYQDLMSADQPLAAVFGQEAVRLILHLLMGALTCVGLGLARFRVPRWRATLVGCLVASMSLHVCWDYFCGLPALDAAAALQQRAIAVGLMLTVLILFGSTVVVAVRHSGNTHAADNLKHLWGWPFHNMSYRQESRSRSDD